MDIQTLVINLRSERDRLTAAINALESIGTSGSTPISTPTKRRGRKPKRHMSAEGRAKIAAAARKRWAAAKRAGKTTLAR